MLAAICTVLVWIVSLHAIRHILVLGNYPHDAMREVLVIMLLATCLIFLMSAFWQAYNIYLFRGNDRRKAVPMPSDAELAAAFSLSLPNYHAVQESSFVEVSSLDDFGYHVKARPVREA